MGGCGAAVLDRQIPARSNDPKIKPQLWGWTLFQLIDSFRGNWGNNKTASLCSVWRHIIRLTQSFLPKGTSAWGQLEIDPLIFYSGSPTLPPEHKEKYNKNIISLCNTTHWDEHILFPFTSEFCITGKLRTRALDVPLSVFFQEASQLIPFFPLSLFCQIECSSISEYSERIIKSNHLHSGKSCCCSLSLRVDGAALQSAEGGK